MSRLSIDDPVQRLQATFAKSIGHQLLWKDRIKAR